MEKKLLSFVVLIIVSTSGYSQTLWEEDFETYNLLTGLVGINPTEVGDYPATTPFTIDATDTDFNDSDNDYIRISGEKIEARDLDGEAIITFDAVDISSQTGNVTIAIGDVDFNITSSSSNWGGGEYIDVLYSLDNGTTFTLIVNHNGLGDAEHTFIIPEAGLADGEDLDTFVMETIDPGAATSIILQLRGENTGSNEEFEFDDIDISRNAVSLWSEDFSGYTEPSGVIGTSSEGFANSGDYPSSVTKWTLGLLDANQLKTTADFALVTDASENGSKVYKLNDVNDNVTFETQAITISGESQITFGMDITFDETSYEADDFVDVFYSIDGGTIFTLVQDDGSGHTFGGDNITANYNTPTTKSVQFSETLNGLSASELIIRIVAISDSASEDYEIDNIKVVVGNSLSITSNELDRSINLYPNPVENGLLHLKSTLNNTLSIDLYDISGRKVFSSKIENQPITKLNVNYLKSGIYLAKLTQGNTNITKKVVIK